MILIRHWFLEYLIRTVISLIQFNAQNQMSKCYRFISIEYWNRGTGQLSIGLRVWTRSTDFASSKQSTNNVCYFTVLTHISKIGWLPYFASILSSFRWVDLFHSSEIMLVSHYQSPMCVQYTNKSISFTVTHILVRVQLIRQLTSLGPACSFTHSTDCFIILIGLLWILAILLNLLSSARQ